MKSNIAALVTKPERQKMALMELITPKEDEDPEFIMKDKLIEAAAIILGGSVKRLSLFQLWRLMTVTQHVTGLCLNEIEDRGELTFHDDGTHNGPIVPYMSDHHVDTILTR